MKLALIRRQFSATGGAELYLQRLMAALVDGGHEIHLFAESWGKPPANVALHPVAVSGSRARRPVRFAEMVQGELARHAFDCVFSLERTLKQDVYRAGDGVHRVWLERRRQFAPWWKRPFIGRGAFHRNMLALEAQTFDPTNTRRIIVNSEMVKREILQHFRFPEERIHLVRNGVEGKRFQSGKRAETRARFGIKDDEFLLLFVGSGWERKGLRYVVKALQSLQFLLLTQTVEEIMQSMESILLHTVETAKRVLSGKPGALPLELPIRNKQVKLLVVGKGRTWDAVNANAMFAGSMPDVENAYAAADLFVMPPIYEPSSNVVLEALAAGLPVITSIYNGASEFIEDQCNGSVVDDPADPEALRDAILFWMAHHPIKAGVSNYDLSLERNVIETAGVLELAAQEKRG